MDGDFSSSDPSSVIVDGQTHQSAIYAVFKTDRFLEQNLRDWRNVERRRSDEMVGSAGLEPATSCL